MLGDAPSQYVFADYSDVGGLKLPHKITIRKLGQPVLGGAVRVRRRQRR